ncbi:MAG: hypothetical protein CPDRYMAC_1605 [uncultured Paraburkholderia sp.]|nr:MAG: hypothetical protein CPDRYDRY_1577 [uncultured Paraburkholderia sp.]CAH2919611.1 MAG: hypothetical protein CPDRYMAC_1605 [uncultured Paraburkholderia sp.]
MKQTLQDRLREAKATKKLYSKRVRRPVKQAMKYGDMILKLRSGVASTRIRSVIERIAATGGRRR